MILLQLEISGATTNYDPALSMINSLTDEGSILQTQVGVLPFSED